MCSLKGYELDLEKYESYLKKENHFQSVCRFRKKHVQCME